MTASYVRYPIFRSLAIVLAVAVGSTLLALPAAAAEPQPGQEFGVGQFDQIKDYLPPYFFEYLNVYKEESAELKIIVSETKPAGLPDRYAELTKEHYKKITIDPNGAIHGYVAGQPFPNSQGGLDVGTIDDNDPLAGWKHFWNYTFRPVANELSGDNNVVIQDRRGKAAYQVNAYTDFPAKHRTEMGDIDLTGAGERWLLSRYYFKEPAAKRYQAAVFIKLDPSQNFDAGQEVYAYLPSLRRIVPQSGAIHCAPASGTDYYNDDIFGFYGVPSWFDAKFKGHQKILIPAFLPEEYTDIWPIDKARQLWTAGWLPKAAPYWQLRDVYVIELIPNAEHSSYCYPMKRIYLDAENYEPAWMEIADSQGKPWKFSFWAISPHEWRTGGYGWRYNASFTVDLQAKHASVVTIPNWVVGRNNFTLSDMLPQGLLKIVK